MLQSLYAEYTTKIRSGMEACIAKTESLYFHFLIKYFTFLSSILKEHCKIYFTIALMSPDQIWLDIIWADKICI